MIVYAKSMSWSVNGVVQGELSGEMTLSSDCDISDNDYLYKEKEKIISSSFIATITNSKNMGFVDFLVNPNKKCYFARDTMSLKSFKKYIKTN